MTEAAVNRSLDAVEALELFRMKINTVIASSFKSLMETRGLYQSVSIDRASASQYAQNRVVKAYEPEFARLLQLNYPEHRNFALAESALYTAGSKEELLVIRPVNFKLFCAKCDRDEAFKPLWFQDITSETAKASLAGGRTSIRTQEGFQIFSLVYQCQSCLGPPEAFLIRRDLLKLSLHGRSPIQNVMVPKVIPKPESKWYREAIIAMNVARTLAAIFYLRTFIEQFARRVTQIQGRRTGDEILSEYNGTLPEPPRSAMPSLKEWYEKLSEAIHSANEDIEMLKTAFEEVDRHFEFRALYKMSEVPPKIGSVVDAHNGSIDTTSVGDK